MSRGESPEIEALFATEAAERADRIAAGIAHPGALSPAALDDLRREAHTISGAAAMLGRDQVAEHAARAEALLRAAQGKGELSDEATREIAAAVEGIRAELGAADGNT